MSAILSTVNFDIFIFKHIVFTLTHDSLKKSNSNTLPYVLKTTRRTVTSSLIFVFLIPRDLLLYLLKIVMVLPQVILKIAMVEQACSMQNGAYARDVIAAILVYL